MASFAVYLDKLDKKLQEKNKVNDLLAKAEKATGVRRVYIAIGAFSLWSLYMILGCCAELICNIIGFGYPAYASLVALETRTKEDDTKWLIYWVTFAAFSILEFFSEFILRFIPFYWLLKCIFFIWCFMPIDKNGSDFLYNRIIRPFFLKNQRSIQEGIDKAASGITGLAQEAAKRATKSD